MSDTRTLGVAVHVVLDLTRMDDTELETLVEGLEAGSKTAAICKTVPAIKTACDAASAGLTTYTTTRTSLNLLIKQLPPLRKAAATQRSTVLRNVSQARSLVQNNATVAQDALDVGFTEAQAGVAPQPDVLPKPDGAIFKPGKHKYTIPRVVVVDDRDRAHFGCQISPDPMGPNTFVDSPGIGKTRKIQGYASGTVLWAHFCALVGGKRSDYCDPIRFVVP